MESPTQAQTTSASPVVTSTVSTSVANPVVAIPVPVVQPIEGTYMYVFVKGSLYANFTSLFGLSNDETQALSKRYGNASTSIDNGLMIKAAPTELINALAQLSYKVICSTGEAEITWTLQREA